MKMYLKLVIFEYESKQIIGKYKNVVKSGDKKQVNTKFLLRPKKKGSLISFLFYVTTSI